MRIVYDYPPPFLGLNPGIFEMTVAQLKRGHQIELWCGGWPRKRQISEEILDRVLHDNRLKSNLKVRIFPAAVPILDIYALTVLFVFLSLLFRSKNIAKSFDIVHCHGNLSLAFILARKFSRLSRIKFVFHLHITAKGREEKALKNKEKIKFFDRCFRWQLHKYSDRLGCASADAILCSSKSVEEEAIKFCSASPDKITVINNGVNFDTFNPEGEDLRQDFGYSENDRIIISVGTISPRKGSLDLVRALQKLPQNYFLMLVGKGNKKFLMDVKSEIQQVGLTQKVRITGSVDYFDLSKYYRTADIFVLPSSYEGFPKVVLEALACGLPVLTSRSFETNPGFAQFIRYLPSTEPADITREILGTIKSPQKIDTKKLRGNYSWEAITAKIDNIYAGLAKYFRL
ncbi:MAG: glycosyltransferase family 4 protein [Actinobacteria bacterium]|nr:glycosyltransferase family 4 protein [Actinomycetota bacterium]